MAKIRSGGGINSSVVTKPPVRTGKAAVGVNPGGADQLGQLVGKMTASTPLFSGERPISVKLGNELAGNVGTGGPGVGRTVHRAGSQAQYGSAAGAERPAGRDILSSFGPDKRR